MSRGGESGTNHNVFDGFVGVLSYEHHQPVKIIMLSMTSVRVLPYENHETAQIIMFSTIFVRVLPYRGCHLCRVFWVSTYAMLYASA